MSIFIRKITLLPLFCLLLFLGCAPELEENTDLKAANRRVLGASANDLLSDQVYTSLRIEVAYVQGYGPSTSALKNLKSFLELYVYKPKGINLVLTPIEAPGKAPYSIEEIREIEERTRTVYNKGEELAVFIFFADGKSEADEDTDLVLGTAYRNTSMVLFEETLRHLANYSLWVSKDEITEATLQHEFGHLFGLVDNGSPSKTNHMDPDSKSHCNVSGCLMMASMEFGKGMLEHLKSQQSTHFDEKCHQDLIANGGKI